MLCGILKRGYTSIVGWVTDWLHPKKEQTGGGACVCVCVCVCEAGVKQEKNSLVCSIPKKGRNAASNYFGGDMKEQHGGGSETIALKSSCRR